MLRLKYGNTNTYFLQGTCGSILIDTDYAGTMPAFYKELKKNNKGDQKNKPAKKHQASNKKDEPVIIRREVIISDEEIVKKEEEEKQKRQKEREKQLGFVERNKSKDFNIVYRNKQTKFIPLFFILSFLYWAPQIWVQYSRWGFMRAE